MNCSTLNVSALCCDEEISGYDKLTGKTWIYPTNYPVRDYQFNIIKAAILKNTLVSLPTGLGKTFIAAVIMYNFYRWYPLGKIVFTAPTRPLVAQQIDACYNIIAIPPNDTIEMTGHMQVNTRKLHWQNKRVFFATPQVIYNDIKSGICPSEQIRCLVIDEAHRARGNYAYCQIISTLTELGHKTYRILALSATPGSKVEDVINVVKNLHIAHLELRTENCIDVSPYSHSRKINTVIINLGPELTQLRQQYIEILDGYARRLKQLNILPTNLGNLSKGRIVMLYKEYQTKERGARHPQHNYIMKDFSLLIALYHGLELLVKHGSRVFLNFFDEHPEKSWIQSDDKLTALLERLRDDLGINPLSLNRSILPDGTVPELPNDLCFGHPKFDKLKQIMMEHFMQAKKKCQDTRAIVFCEYRESVNLVHCLLLQCRPLITPQMFVGQGASGKDGKTIVSQKQQLRVMRNFREGACNTLVATCVAEEGLDVGSVDLILCFDISSRSPIRLVQRCGRTGRERGGQVFILVTEGREHQTLLDCMRQRDGLNKKVLQSKEVENNLYKTNPRMIPYDFTPECQKMYITVEKKVDPKDKNKEAEKNKKGQKDLRSMLLGRASTSNIANKEVGNMDFISESEFKDLFPDGIRTMPFVDAQEFWSLNTETIHDISKQQEMDSRLKFSTWLEWQRNLQETVNIGHSSDTNILASLLQYGDAKRFELPISTQNPTFTSQQTQISSPMKTMQLPSSPAKSKLITSSPNKAKQQKKKQKPPLFKSPGKKDGDIRALFSTATKSTKSYTKLINELGITNDGSIPTHLINLLVDLNLDNSSKEKTCYICQNICDCSLLEQAKKNSTKSTQFAFLKELALPDISLIDDINVDSILNCVNINTNLVNADKEIEEFDIKDDKINQSNNFDLEFDFEAFDKVDELEEKEKLDNISQTNFDIGDIEDIFADSSPEEAIAKDVDEVNDKDCSSKSSPKDTKDALGFFGLNSIDDIFADYDESIEKESPKPNAKVETNVNKSEQVERKEDEIELPKPMQIPQQLSPSILSGRPTTNTISTSPILCSQTRKFQLSTKKKKHDSSTPNQGAKKRLSYEFNNTTRAQKEDVNNSTNTTNNKSMFTITQLVEIINKTNDDQSISAKFNKANFRDEERSTSPILLTQADRKIQNLNTSVNTKVSLPKKNESLIILDSDSESDNTQVYDLNEANQGESFADFSPVSNKRKLDSVIDNDSIMASPHFYKKQKLNDCNNKPLTLQEKVLAAITSNKINNNKYSNNASINFAITPPKFASQKENKMPQYFDTEQCNGKDEKEHCKKSNLDMLQIFRRDSKTPSSEITKLKGIVNKSPKKTLLSKSVKREISFDDSDDDFVNEEKTHRSQNKVKNASITPITNHKKRKKRRRGNGFLDLEADLSDPEEADSGDELSDDSTGSIADFICAESQAEPEDMHAFYLRSVKSPVKGVFKIPEIPKTYSNSAVFSQFVEDDTYEMDSFCVDDNIGLTQVNRVSELELAEIVLEEEKRSKKRNRAEYVEDNDDTPVIKRKHARIRRIDSDSDDSS